MCRCPAGQQTGREPSRTRRWTPSASVTLSSSAEPQEKRPMSQLVAEIIVETLREAGVQRCYGIVGDTLNRIAEEIEKSDIEWVHMRHEEAGAFAAQAESLATGHLTAIAGSCGPGSLHFINGVYEARRNPAPGILIPGQGPPE